MPIGPMTPLISVTDPATARILVAHLGAAGITWELRGNHGGPYPVGPVEILVAEADLDLARAILREDGAGPQPGPVQERRAPERATLVPWVLVVIVVVLALVLLARLVAQV